MFLLFFANFMKFGYFTDFIKLNWMWYGFKTRNDQKGSKMAAKSKMAAENYDFIIFFNKHSYVRLIRVFSGGNFISDSILLNKSMFKAQGGDQIQDCRDI